jgi:two-component system sensor histidine kinase YesM
MIFKPRLIRFRDFRLSTKLMIAYLLLTVLPMSLLGYISYAQYAKSIIQQAGEDMPEFLDQANANIDKHLSDLAALPDLLFNSEEALSILRRDSYQSRADLNRDQYAMNSYLSRTYIEGGYQDVVGVFILSKHRVFESSKWKVSGMDWNRVPNPYGEDPELGGQARILLPGEAGLRFANGEPYLLLMRQINDTDNRKILGTMLVAIQLSYIDHVLRNLERTANAQLWMMNAQGEIIYHTDRGKIGARDQETAYYPLKSGSFIRRGAGPSRLISLSPSEVYGWSLAYSIPLADLTRRTDLVRNVTILIFIVFVTITALFSVLFSLRVTRPLHKLSILMKEVETGNFRVDLPVERRDEAGMLAQSFNSMVSTIRDLIDKNYRIEISHKEAELYALQSQIQPHFLYNTLESIGMAVEEGEKETVVEMVTLLGRMLRFSVGNKSKYVTIGEELQHTRDYLAIQKFRFEDRLTFAIGNNAVCAGEPRYTPKFILQPVVENAVKHGLEARRSLHLDISADREVRDSGEWDIVFRVRDNGPGISPERMRELEAQLQTDELDRRDSGLGLKNVNARIRIMLGRDYGLQLHSRPGEGTEVELRIPELTSPGGPTKARGGENRG